MSVARRLAQFLVGTRFQELPAQVVDNAKLAIADTFASALAGDAVETVGVVRCLVLERGGNPEATLWGRGGARVPAPHAAWANAVLADVLAFNESHIATIAHVCGATVPAAVAAAERAGAGGQDLVVAVALGYEAAGRIGSSVAPAYFHQQGFHNSVVTIFGAAVAAAKVLGLPEDAMTHTIALAATSAGGLVGSRKTDARQYHGGNSALLGMNAALAAALGYEGMETALEDPEGYCRAFGEDATPESITEALGQRWELVTQLAPKLMPGSHGLHTVVEATLGACQAGHVTPDNVARIIVTGPRWKTSYGIYRPQDVAGASHSIPYFVARALVDGKIDWDDLTPARVVDPATWALQDRVEIIEDKTQGPYDYPGGATVTIITEDGKCFTHAVEHALGTPQRGYSWDQIEAKYRTLAPRGGLSPRQVDEGLALLRGLEQMEHIGELIPYLVAAQP